MEKIKVANKYQKSIDLLNDALGKEIATSLQYMYFHVHFEDAGYEYLSKKMRMISIAEMRHSEELSDRILFLQGGREYEPVVYDAPDLRSQGDVPFRYTAGTEYDRQL